MGVPPNRPTSDIKNQQQIKGLLQKAHKVNARFTCTNWTISWFSKLVPHRDDYAERAEDKYCNKIDEPRDKATVEAVVEPRNERTHCQQRNTTVVKSATAVSQGCIKYFTTFVNKARLRSVHTVLPNRVHANSGEPHSYNI